MLANNLYGVNESDLKDKKELGKKVAEETFAKDVKEMFQDKDKLTSNLYYYKDLDKQDLDIKKAQGSMKMDSTNCDEKDCPLGNIFSSSSRSERTTKSEEVGFIKDEQGNIIDNKGFLDKVKKRAREAGQNFDYIKGEYKDCKPHEVTNKYTTLKFCDQYYDIAHNSCPIDQVVEIDPRYIYQCSKRREIKEKVCIETIIRHCESDMDCKEDKGGIVEGSVNAGIEWAYHYPYLRLGSKTGHWHFSCEGNCCNKVEMSAQFKIRALNKIKKFVLHKISYDDHAMIYLNGHMVYNTLGGSKLEITEKKDSSGYYTKEGGFLGFFQDDVFHSRPGSTSLIVDGGGGGSKACWRLFPGHGIDHYEVIDKDLKPFLKQGVNEVTMVLVYAMRGQFNVFFETGQYCCSKWKDTSVVQCDYLD